MSSRAGFGGQIQYCGINCVNSNKRGTLTMNLPFIQVGVVETSCEVPDSCTQLHFMLIKSLELLTYVHI